MAGREGVTGEHSQEILVEQSIILAPNEGCQCQNDLPLAPCRQVTLQNCMAWKAFTIKLIVRGHWSMQ